MSSSDSEEYDLVQISTKDGEMRKTLLSGISLNFVCNENTPELNRKSVFVRLLPDGNLMCVLQSLSTEGEHYMRHLIEGTGVMTTKANDINGIARMTYYYMQENEFVRGRVIITVEVDGKETRYYSNKFPLHAELQLIPVYRVFRYMKNYTNGEFFGDVYDVIEAYINVARKYNEMTLYRSLPPYDVERENLMHLTSYENLIKLYMEGPGVVVTMRHKRQIVRYCIKPVKVFEKDLVGWFWFPLFSDTGKHGFSMVEHRYGADPYNIIRQKVLMQGIVMLEMGEKKHIDEFTIYAHTYVNNWDLKTKFEHPCVYNMEKRTAKRGDMIKIENELVSGLWNVWFIDDFLVV